METSNGKAVMENEMKTFIPKSDVPKDDEGKTIKKRETWSRKIDFLVACCGFSIGLGNVWKFPFLCYRNGGGAFLLPYFLCVIIGGIPTFFLEVSVGQFMSEGGMNAWRICPLFQGIGLAAAVIVFLVNCDYNVLLSWAFYYFFASLTTQLPWSHCDNEWNTPECTAGFVTENKCVVSNISVSSNASALSYVLNLANSTDDVDVTYQGMVNCTENLLKSVAEKSNRTYVSDPVTEFWERKVLDISEGVDQPGVIKWDLCLCLLLAWIVVYFCIWKGIKGSGKVMYFTVTSPYILMIILLIRGLTLDGAMDGIKFYLVPDFSKLLKFQVWADAGNQVFYSYSLSSGILVALGSYNKFNHNAYRDCFMFSIMNSVTSILSGFVIFSVLGFMALKQNVSIDQVAESGPGLAFIAYPEAVSQMPAAPLWSAIFFLMIILLGLDSQFVGVEGFVTCVVDLYPNVFRKGYRREILIAVICCVSFLVGLSMVCQGGIYVFQLFDYYSVSRTIFVIAFVEMIVISYVYGINRFLDNLEMMYGNRVLPVFKLLWSFLTPMFILFLFIVGVISYSELTYDRKSVEYHYPQWAIGIGWIMAVASIIWIPVVAGYRIYQADGTFTERIKESIKPKLKKHQIRPKEDMSKIKFICPSNIDL